MGVVLLACIMDCNWKKILIGVLSGITVLLCCVGGGYPDVIHSEKVRGACMKYGLFKTCTLTDCDKLDDDQCKTNKKENYADDKDWKEVQTSQGLYMVALLCVGIGWIVGIVSCFCCGKMMLIASVILHILSGLFFMACGGYLTDTKAGKTVKDGSGGIKYEWGYTFASCWLCWLLSWIIGGFSIFACMAEAPAGGDGVAGKV